jgi:DNA-binding beta-propeller fold protein YncE
MLPVLQTGPWTGVMKASFGRVMVGMLLLSATIAWCFTGAITTAAAPQATDAWNAAAASPIQVNEWFTPERGWLYVLDSQPQADSPSGRIWLIDPSSGRIMGNITTGADPDFALSPDGTRLYVASKGKDRSSNIAIINTMGGTVLKTVTVDSRVVTDGIPSYPSMGVSDDGLALWILARDVTSLDADYVLDTLDTRTGDSLDDAIDLGSCGRGRFIDHPSENQFDFLCTINNRIRQVNIDPKTHQPDHEVVEFPWLRRLGVADAFLAPGGRAISVIRGDGAVYNMDIDTAQFSETRMHGGVEGMILRAQWPVSPDGTRIYVGYNLHPTEHLYMNFERSPDAARTDEAYELCAIDTNSWRTLGHTSGKGAPYWSAAISPDGKSLYALSPQNHAVVVFDTEVFHETRVIPVGGSPALALVAP